ncbi:MAG TPA: SseB family protein [Usitatibacter sp.]|nr:SseB family protein [Usitatibacter sp.]
MSRGSTTSSCPASDQGRGAFFAVFLFAGATMLAGCSHSSTRVDAQGAPSLSREDSIERLVAVVRAEPSKKALLAKAVMSGDVLVIPDPGKKSLALVSFNQPERSFIPLFSSRSIFDQEAYGTGFEGKAIVIDATRFASLLENDDLVILNPGHRPAIEFNAQELKAAIAK